MATQTITNGFGERIQCQTRRLARGWGAYFKVIEEPCQGWHPVFRGDLRDYQTSEEAMAAVLRFVDRKPT